MTYTLAVILGLVQGVAEFLPISSSGHLSLLQHFFGMENNDNLFNILLHFATLLAVCVAYRRDIGEMILEFFRAIGDLARGRTTQGNPPEARRMILLIIVGTLPLFLVLLVKDRVEALGNSPVFVSCALLVTGCILFFSDRMAKGHKTVRTATSTMVNTGVTTVTRLVDAPSTRMSSEIQGMGTVTGWATPPVK